MQRRYLFRSVAALVALGAVGTTFFAAGDARAQISGTSSKPLPDVLLLVDTSGSMERKVDGTLPTCKPGDSTSDVNRWGMLLQALTGNIQPFFSCNSVSRSSTSDFAIRYGINSIKPYDADYFLPYNQPLSGGTPATACANEPWHLPGTSTGNGVGINHLGVTGTTALDFPDTAIGQVLNTSITTGGLKQGLQDTISATDACAFSQTNDGQLDATKYYARFALMTFDNDVNGLTGLDTSNYINPAAPFTGTWSFLRHSGDEYYSGAMNDSILGAQGKPGTTPPCLTITPQEVGARNAGAPPWEGRLVNFPSPDATIYEMDTQNSQIQQVLLASRPYGATPIDGMMDDARDYYWNTPGGPSEDPYTCRDRYIILLTDGAPNLDLRPSCGYTNGVCPYPKNAGEIANAMYLATAPTQHVTTYVIGFSVNGTTETGNGFPPGINDCKTWFDVAAAGATDEKQQATNMHNVCVGTPPAVGSTAEACCKLNDIALLGAGTGAYFAESQADIVLSFGRILANIIHSASTKVAPVFSPAAQFTNGGVASSSTTTVSAGEFISSYIPSSQRPWSGEIDRTRFQCTTGDVSTAQAEDKTKGDFESENLASQSSSKQRLFISVLGDKPGAVLDSAASIRPFANGATPSSTGGDNVGAPSTTDATYSGTEVNMNGYSLHFNTDWPLALNITNQTCKRGRAVKEGVGAARGTDIIPALDGPTGAADCTDVVWGFTTADPDDIKFSGTPASAGSYEFNVRCRGTSSLTGTCSISGSACVPGSTSSTCPTGEVCVPACSALGAIYHSTPAIVPPPANLLREEGFRQYQANRASRRPVMYAASTDGILHAFKALEGGGPTATHELWSFVPPAVLPQLASNYPSGNQILLDGAPVVRETVWDRASSATSAANLWHSTLVAGLGTIGGYYAMNVTDADCGGSSGPIGECLANYVAPGHNQQGEAATNGDASDSTAKKGPHFLWQLTDIPATSGTSELAKIERTSTFGNKQAALFGKNTSTPAVGMIDIKGKTDGADHQIGIAILPGGYEDPPVANGSCQRAAKAAANIYTDLPYRTYVRQWAKGNCATAPVPGRGVTIVRLDNGEIIRHFGRKNQDVPQAIIANVIDTPFDSPMVGTPVVYPDQVGVPIQKVFIGDADGTVWRIDLSSTNPDDWHANLYADLPGPGGNTASTAGALNSQPVNVPPVLSTDDSGNLILNVATGDQESIVVSSDVNYLYSIRELRDATGVHAQTLWYKAFTGSERVTGPMSVFDKTLYFASYLPQRPVGGVCTSLGTARLWGFDYITPKDAAAISSGGKSAWCKAGDVNVTTGLCGGTPVDEEDQGSDIIPGVSLVGSQACATDGTADEYGNSAFASVSSVQYSLSFGIARPNPSGTTPPQADRKSIRRPLPQTQTRIDSWSIVVD